MGQEDTGAKKVTTELFKMQPDAMLEFFEIDFSNLQADFSFLDKRHKVTFSTEGSPVYRFTSNVNGTNPIFWQGKGYQPLPIDAEGFEIPSDGRLPRPKLRIANPSGLLSSIVAVNYDFHGCKVTRKRTFAKFLDDANFPAHETTYEDVDGNTVSVDRNVIGRGTEDAKNPFGTPDAHAHLPDEVYYVYRKVGETKEGLEFELTSILEVEGVKFPGRQMMSDHCSFRYRGEGCGYSGLPVTGPDGERFSNYGIYKFKIDGLDVPPGQDFTKITIPWWKTEMNYQKGDIVQINPHKEPDVPSVFVCIQQHSQPSPNPPASSEHWIMDACPKTLSSCIQRFGYRCSSSKGGVPFGGFPSVENYKHG